MAPPVTGPGRRHRRHGAPFKKTLTPADLDLATAEDEGLGDSLKEVRSAAERDHVVKVLGKCGWNISKAAQEMGISRPTLHDFLKKHNISKG